MRRLYTWILYSTVNMQVVHLLFPKPPPLSRNAALRGLFDGSKTPKPLKTGTTIAGVVFKASTGVQAEKQHFSGSRLLKLIFHPRYLS